MTARTLTLIALCSATLPGAARAQVATAGPADTLTFADALTTALERDPRVAAAGAGVDAARAGRAQARAAWLPTVASSGTLTRFAEPMVVAPLHGFDPGSPPQFDRTLAQGRLTVAWTVFDGGARSARIAAAGARATGADAGAAQARQDVILELLDAYLRVAGARDLAAAQRTREQDLAEETARAERFVDEGAAPRLELLRAQAELEGTRATGVGADAARAAAESDLARLVGAPAERVGGAAVEQVRVSATAPPPEGDPIESHPALRAARARTEAAQALTREARSAWLPRVQGTGGLVEYGTGTGGFRGEWQAGLQADYSIFAGGARGARVDEARAEARRAAAEEQAVRDALERASDQAAAALAEATARAAALARAVASFEELARVEALALTEGAGVQADYLRALAGLHGARTGLADAGRTVVLARARLARAQGRLDEGWIETHLEEVP